MEHTARSYRREKANTHVSQCKKQFLRFQVFRLKKKCCSLWLRKLRAVIKRNVSFFEKMNHSILDLNSRSACVWRKKMETNYSSSGVCFLWRQQFRHALENESIASTHLSLVERKAVLVPHNPKEYKISYQKKWVCANTVQIDLDFSVSYDADWICRKSEWRESKFYEMQKKTEIVVTYLDTILHSSETRFSAKVCLVQETKSDTCFFSGKEALARQQRESENTRENALTSRLYLEGESDK